MEIRSSITETKGKLEQAKRLQNSSQEISDSITIHHELTDRIRPAVV